MATKVTKKEKLEALGIKHNLKKEYVDTLYATHILNNKNKNPKKVIKKPVHNIDKTSQKYVLLLEFINKILVNIGKNEIDDLTKFKNIDRIDIIKPKNKVILEDMAPKLFKHFNKAKSGYYKKTKNQVLNVIRGLCKQNGLILKSKPKSLTSKINGSYYGRTHMLYSIKNI